MSHRRSLIGAACYALAAVLFLALAMSYWRESSPVPAGVFVLGALASATMSVLTLRTGSRG